MDIDAIVNGALDSAEAGALTLKDQILAAVKALIENLIEVFHKIIGIEAL